MFVVAKMCKHFNQKVARVSQLKSKFGLRIISNFYNKER